MRDQIQRLREHLEKFGTSEQVTIWQGEINDLRRDLEKKFADLKGNETVYDLYCGIGTISLFLAKDAKQIIGIETINDAIISARSNAELNHISNCEFINGDVKDIINKPIKNHENPDIIIVDPPRNGLDKSVIHSLIKLSPDKIIYVSCNSSTQARDIIDLKEFMN